jgi:hypothetical protein
MKSGIDAMKIALRVLGALTEKQQPAEKDVAELRRLAPQSDAAETDELACEVIQQALRARAQSRAKASGE